MSNTPSNNAKIDNSSALRGTPLLEALAEAASWLSTRQKRFANEQQQVLLFTDGRLKEWSTLPLIECPGILVDIERGPIRLGRAKQMATGLGMDYRHIDELKTVVTTYLGESQT